MIYLDFDPERKTVGYLAAHFLGQPGIARMADDLGCDQHVAARIAAVKAYQSGVRTTTVADITMICRADSPVGPLDPDPPGPGIHAPEHGRAA